jgi:hypothetical protein
VKVFKFAAKVSEGKYFLTRKRGTAGARRFSSAVKKLAGKSKMGIQQTISLARYPAYSRKSRNPPVLLPEHLFYRAGISTFRTTPEIPAIARDAFC